MARQPSEGPSVDLSTWLERLLSWGESLSVRELAQLGLKGIVTGIALGVAWILWKRFRNPLLIVGAIAGVLAIWFLS